MVLTDLPLALDRAPVSGEPPASDLPFGHVPLAEVTAPDRQNFGQLVGVMGELNAGVFEIAGEDTGRNPERVREYTDRLKALAVDTGTPVTFGIFATRNDPPLSPKLSIAVFSASIAFETVCVPETNASNTSPTPFSIDWKTSK